MSRLAIWRLLALGGALAGASGVGLGALAAHALRGQISAARLEAFRTAVLYQLLHAVALLALAAWAAAAPPARAALAWAGGLWGAGILLFSGSLYGLVLVDLPRLGIVTPLGGLALIGGWLAVGWAACSG